MDVVDHVVLVNLVWNVLSLNALLPGEISRVDGSLTNKYYKATLDSDGAICVIPFANPMRPEACSSTNFNDASYMMFDIENKLHIYDTKGNPKISFSDKQGAVLLLQDDGNLVLYAQDKKTSLWNIKNNKPNL